MVVADFDVKSEEIALLAVEITPSAAFPGKTEPTASIPALMGVFSPVKTVSTPLLLLTSTTVSAVTATPIPTALAIEDTPGADNAPTTNDAPTLVPSILETASLKVLPLASDTVTCAKASTPAERAPVNRSLMYIAFSLH